MKHEAPELTKSPKPASKYRSSAQYLGIFLLGASTSLGIAKANPAILLSPQDNVLEKSEGGNTVSKERLYAEKMHELANDLTSRLQAGETVDTKVFNGGLQFFDKELAVQYPLSLGQSPSTSWFGTVNFDSNGAPMVNLIEVEGSDSVYIPYDLDNVILETELSSIKSGQLDVLIDGEPQEFVVGEQFFGTSY